MTLWGSRTVLLGDEAFDVSEKNRTKALGCIERARQRKSNGDVEGAKVEVKKAWHALEEALDICPMNHRARFLLVSCAMNADDYVRAKAEALRIYYDLSEEQLRNLNDSVLHLSITHTSKMLGEPEDAIKFATEATDLFPEDPQPYMVLGELHMAADDHTEAEKRCRMALMHNESPTCTRPLNEQNVYVTLCCLGAALANQSKYSEAEIFLEKAARQDASATLALSTLVDVYHLQGQPDKARQVAEQLRELDPGDEKIQSQSHKSPQRQSGTSKTSKASSRPSRNLSPVTIKDEDIQDSQSLQSHQRQPEPVGLSDAESIGSCPTKPRPTRGSGRLGPGSDRGSTGSDCRSLRGAPPAGGTEEGPPRESQQRDGCLGLCCFDRVYEEMQPV